MINKTFFIDKQSEFELYFDADCIITMNIYDNFTHDCIIPKIEKDSRTEAEIEIDRLIHALGLEGYPITKELIIELHSTKTNIKQFLARIYEQGEYIYMLMLQLLSAYNLIEIEKPETYTLSNEEVEIMLKSDDDNQDKPIIMEDTIILNQIEETEIPIISYKYYDLNTPGKVKFIYNSDEIEIREFTIFFRDNRVLEWKETIGDKNFIVNVDGKIIDTRPPINTTSIGFTITQNNEITAVNSTPNIQKHKKGSALVLMDIRKATKDEKDQFEKFDKSNLKRKRKKQYQKNKKKNEPVNNNE